MNIIYIIFSNIGCRMKYLYKINLYYVITTINCLTRHQLIVKLEHSYYSSSFIFFRFDKKSYL